ncbi:hypothetical protein CAPTEDRAFT_207147 [Capitella teleta]|uniref:Reverse transcriptase domain-containing protein n=1 Tax=Capitella teleta TaxID=283909 RepID=R7T738_CAPTE|nr:hypothetical protein CAPTEDRAFT_207147 [Capitella teleta]|eukprot:ELT87175.1 hypothetical protein CAPTEDRAFT_207147 [Capitella teleta]
MGKCLEEVRNWMCTNRLKLNEAKTELLIVCKKSGQKQAEEISLNICSANIKPTTVAKTLGAFFDSHLTMQNQSVLFNENNIEWVLDVFRLSRLALNQMNIEIDCIEGFFEVKEQADYFIAYTPDRSLWKSIRCSI